MKIKQQQKKEDQFRKEYEEAKEKYGLRWDKGPERFGKWQYAETGRQSRS